MLDLRKLLLTERDLSETVVDFLSGMDAANERVARTETTTMLIETEQCILREFEWTIQQQSRYEQT